MSRKPGRHRLLQILPLLSNGKNGGSEVPVQSKHDQGFHSMGILQVCSLPSPKSHVEV